MSEKKPLRKVFYNQEYFKGFIKYAKLDEHIKIEGLSGGALKKSFEIVIASEEIKKRYLEYCHYIYNKDSRNPK